MTFCVLPFVHICLERNGSYMPCGQSLNYPGNNNDTIESVWNNEFYRKLRLDLINGVRHKNCQTCWLHEDKNQFSRRQRYNEWLENTPDVIASKQEAIENDGKITRLPVQINLKLDNTCNLKCPTCNPYQSSQHEKELEQLKEHDVKLTKWLSFVDSQFSIHGVDKTKLPDHILSYMSNLKELSIEGGEPFANKVMLELLDYFIDNNLFDIKLVTTTNLSSLTDKLIDKLSKFNDVNLWISYDSLDDEIFNFIRYPANYKHFLKNLELLQKTNCKINFAFTQSIFNVFETATVLKKFEKYNDIIGEVVYRCVIEPKYFSIQYLDKELKEKAKQIYLAYLNTDSPLLSRGGLKQGLNDAVNLCDLPEVETSDIIEERYRMLNAYDKIRGTDYKRLFPYL